MANWTFNPNEYEERDFTIIPAGDHRVRIADVVERTFKSGNEGYEITFDVSGHGGKLWYYLVLNKADQKQTNQNLGTFFECFGITNYTMGNGKQWIGKVGGCRVKHEEYNGSQSAKVQYLLNRKKQDQLPPWQGKAATAPAAGFTQVEDELPFE